MGFSPKGITSLSELGIDVSKDWGTYLIKNIGDAVDAQDAVAYHQLGDCFEDFQAWFTGELERVMHDALDLIEAMIDYKMGGLLVWVMFWLTIPAPEISQVTEQHSSPPGRTATPSLAIPEPAVSVVAEIV